MASEIKLFLTVQSWYKMLGIYPAQPNRSPSFSFKFFLVLLMTALNFIESVTFFIFEANTVMDYGLAFSASFFAFSSSFYCIVNKIRIPNILKLIGNCEKFIGKSKSSNQRENDSKAIVLIQYFLYFFSHIFRITPYDSQRTVHGITQQNRKNSEASLLLFSLFIYIGRPGIWSNCWLHQLLHSRHERGLFSVAHTSDVRIRIILLMQKFQHVNLFHSFQIAIQLENSLRVFYCDDPFVCHTFHIAHGCHVNRIVFHRIVFAFHHIC